MCPSGRGAADMTRIPNRASTIAALLAIVLLAILLAIIRTGALITKQEAIGERAAAAGIDSAARNSLGSLDGRENETTRILFDRDSFANEVIPGEYGTATEGTGEKSAESISLSTNPDLEYVQLTKISGDRYGVAAEDYSTTDKQDRGHFRHSKAEIWDTHPRYEFTAFGRHFRLSLTLDAEFISPNIKITHWSENTVRREQPGPQLGCFYSGTVDGDPHSSITVSLCHGMRGHMRTSTGSYIIKPVKPWPENDKDSLEFSLQHAIQKVRSSRAHPGRRTYFDDQAKTQGCGVTNDKKPPAILGNVSGEKVYVGSRRRERRSLTEKRTLNHSRHDEEYEQFVGQREDHRNFLRNDNRHEGYYSVERRQNEQQAEEYSQDAEMELDPPETLRSGEALPGEYFIQIMVAADAEMARYHRRGLLDYILTLMSTVSRIYKHQSIGNPINISVVKVIQINRVFASNSSRYRGIAATEMLREFCYWQQSINPNESSPLHYDAALLLTRADLCDNSIRTTCDTLGLAELGRMCSPGNSCAIVQDNGLAAAFTIAHEIGHVLNMPHDDDEEKCSSHMTRGELNIMSRMLDDDTFPWEWSNCSRHYVTEFLDAGNGHCLRNKPLIIMKRQNESILPGQNYSVNRQCELAFDQGYRLCSIMEHDVCKKLWCTASKWNDSDQCQTLHTPWADGTPCAADKWCQEGECVSRMNLDPVDGQWGAWGRYGECSRTCGGGVQKKRRECNDPTPQNGGKYCVGERVRYRSCNTEECPPGSIDFREEQCSRHNRRKHNFDDVPQNAIWHAKYAQILPQDRCKLYCEVDSNRYHRLAPKVIDGTPCDRDTFHVCVNGQCRAAGCDHVLNSKAKIDICGVCKGDNSTCQWITGSYNSSKFGYTTITKIPAGSNNIDIRQHSYIDMHNDFNYLALRLKNGSYILNGKFMVNTEKMINVLGIIMDYSGSKVVERLNTSRPITVDLFLEVLSVKELKPPQITYKFTVPKKILSNYIWVSDWTECSHACQGMKYRKAECRDIQDKDVVSDDYCRSMEKPREIKQMCNTHCTLVWEITWISECSNHCGPGNRTVTSVCVQKLNAMYSSRRISAHACAHLPRPNETEFCIGPCENVHWSYGEWSACSATCGGGIQYRTATCVDWTSRELPEESCARQEKHLKRICGQKPCPTWELGNRTECSVSCGIGIRYREYLCHIENRIVENSYCGNAPSRVVEECNAGPCERYQWHAGNWSLCSATCGEGTRRRKVICKSSDGTISNKCSSSNKPKNTMTCSASNPCPTVVNVPPIKYSSDPPHEIPSQQDNEVYDISFRSGYQWQAGSYKECSRPCVKSYMHVEVKCISIETKIIAPDHYCDKREKPPTMVPCHRHRCPTWNTGDWGPCKGECGRGLQQREVYCQSPSGKTLPDDRCHNSKRPETVKLCWKKPCANNGADQRNRPETNILRKWTVSNWTACSKSCGTGLQRRRVECTMRRGNHGPEVTVKDEHCLRLGLNKPRSQRPCRRVACDYIWQEGPWSECSEECGEGIQYRTVTCHRTNRHGLTDPRPSNNCPMDQKPASEQSCKLRECDDKYYWSAGEWSKCSHTCGQRGRQTRRLFCYDRNHRKVAKYHCPKKFKPHRKQRCNQRKCHPMSCLEAKRYYNTSVDNEYMLLIGGRNMWIYCHEMRSSEPKEYLTLPTGLRENYAEMYDKSLKNSDTCPYNGQRNDSCDCATVSTSGRTLFARVRLDPVKLHIIENDYTFSQTKGPKRVVYGMAGDCYSRASCPQGRFSINLTGTQFKISSNVVWTRTRGASMEIDNISSQHVVGKCGGYCGSCRVSPETGLKLDVLPS